MNLIKICWTGALSLSAILVLTFLVLRLIEQRLTFYPVRDFESMPENFGLRHEEVLLGPGPEGSIHGWFFAPRSETDPVLLVFNGNAGNISHRLDWLAPFVRRGLGALLFDYRGYGLSGGQPGERAFQEDALAVWDFLTTEKGFAPGRIVLAGWSLGGAPAAYLASVRPVGGLILEGTFTRGRVMARQIFGPLPVYLAMKNRWEVAGRLSSVRAPILVIHGTRDSVVPFSEGLELVRTAGRAVEWWPVQGGDHLDLHCLLGEKYYDRIERFARGCLPSGGGD
jgi:uncharacterized protein